MGWAFGRVKEGVGHCQDWASELPREGDSWQRLNIPLAWAWASPWGGVKARVRGFLGSAARGNCAVAWGPQALWGGRLRRERAGLQGRKRTDSSAPTARPVLGGCSSLHTRWLQEGAWGKEAVEPAQTVPTECPAAQSRAVVMSLVAAPDQGYFRGRLGVGTGQREVRAETGHSTGQY